MFFKWRGDGAGTKSAWNDGRNWIDETDAPYAQARYPGSVAGVYDDVVIDQPVTGTAMSIAGYDGSALEVLRSFRVSPLYDGTIGSAETNLKLNFAYIHLNALANTGIYLNSATFTPDDKPTREFNIVSGQNIHIAGWIAPLNVSGSSTAEIKNSATMATSAYYTQVGTGASLTIGESVINVYVKQVGGTVVCSSGGTVIQSGGTWTHVLGSLTHNGSGGTFNWIGGDVAFSGAGVNIITSNGNDARCVKAGSAIYAGSTLDLNNANSNIRIKDAVAMNGGEIKFPTGAKVWLKGEYVVLDGLATGVFHVGNSGANTEASTAYTQLGPYDHLTATLLNSSGTPNDVLVELYCASDDSGTGAEAVLASVLLEGEYDEPSATQNIVRVGAWGMDLPVNKRFVKALVTHASATDTTATVLLELRRF